jgi:hypothetical protein
MPFSGTGSVQEPVLSLLTDERPRTLREIRVELNKYGFNRHQIQKALTGMYGSQLVDRDGVPFQYWITKAGHVRLDQHKTWLELRGSDEEFER